MKASHQVTLKIPDEIFNKITEYRKKSNLPDDESTIFELIKYALSLPSYFTDFDWEKAEKEADNDIASGKVKSFSSAEEFLSDLKA